MLKALIISYLQSVCLLAIGALVPLSVEAGEMPAKPPEYLASFDPAKGFKSAQTDLTAIFLQLAGSLELYGSPEPYFRHVAAEDVRVEKLYVQTRGKQTSIRPTFLTDDALDQFAKNWNHLAPKLELDALAKQVGASIRLSITPSAGTRTPFELLVERQQKTVHNRLVGNRDAGEATNAFNEAIAKLGKEADSPFHSVHEKIDQIVAALDRGLSKSDAERVKSFIGDAMFNVGAAVESELVAGYLGGALSSDKAQKTYDPAQETRLTPAEKQKLAALLVHDHFTKEDFPRLDAFYSSPAYDKLSDAGKDQLSVRVWAGMRGSADR
jgi:hypothetical protein